MSKIHKLRLTGSMVDVMVAAKPRPLLRGQKKVIRESPALARDWSG